MLIDIKGHLINKSEVVYISPIKVGFSGWPYMRSVWADFEIRFRNGSSVKIEEVESPDLDFGEEGEREQFSKLLRNRYDLAKRLELERAKLL